MYQTRILISLPITDIEYLLALGVLFEFALVEGHLIMKDKMF